MLAGGDGGSVNVGGTTPGGAPQLWNLQATPVLADEGLVVANGTLDADMTELFYSKQSRASEAKTQIYRADATGSGFGGENALTLGTWMAKDIDAASPAISSTGTELWLGMLNPANGNTDIYVCKGENDTWTTPLLVTELSSDQGDDQPRPPAVNGTIMSLASKRHGESHLYQIYLSERPDPNSPWSQPLRDKLGDINSPLFQSADGFLNSEGTELYFSSNRDNPGGDSDLYVARRPSVDDVFGAPQRLDDLITTCVDPATTCEERMPWLSPAGDRLYFASNRTGDYALYVATRVTP